METKIFGDKKINFTTITSKEFKFRKEYLDFINKLMEEDVMLLMNKKLTMKEEMDFLKKSAKSVKEKKKVFVIAKDGNKVVANTSVELQPWKKSHIGKFGIAIRKGYRGIGLGTYIMAEVLRLAKEKLPGLKIIQLDVYTINKPAVALYKKMGFKIIATLPKQIQYKGKLVSEYLMIKEVK